MLLELDSKNKRVLFVVSAALLVAGIFYLVWLNFYNKSEPEQIFCTMEAKMCPDGSYVGRSGPKCEFATCPEVRIEAGWKTFTDTGRGVSFQYPETFSTEYIRAFDWPPQLQIIGGPFTCIEGGSEITRAGKTEQRTINGKNYCVTTLMEGAAGSIYGQYAYAFQRGDNVAILTFSTRATQCGNYNDPQKTACENERASFNLDNKIGSVAETLRFDAASGATPTRLPESFNVSIKDFSFNPATLTIHKGDTVSWLNNDSVAHTITGDSGGPNSPQLNPGDIYSYVFKTTGSFSYHCSPHPFMKATVSVVE